MIRPALMHICAKNYQVAFSAKEKSPTARYKNRSCTGRNNITHEYSCIIIF